MRFGTVIFKFGTYINQISLMSVKVTAAIDIFNGNQRHLPYNVNVIGTNNYQMRHLGTYTISCDLIFSFYGSKLNFLVTSYTCISRHLALSQLPFEVAASCVHQRHLITIPFMTDHNISKVSIKAHAPLVNCATMSVLFLQSSTGNKIPNDISN